VSGRFSRAFDNCRVRLRDEKDPERLRTAALLLEQENDRLVQKVVALQKENLALLGKSPEELQLRIAELERQLAQRTQQVFGSKSERRPRTDKPAPEPKAPQTGHGPTQQTLPEVDKLHALDAPDLTCKQCGLTMTEWEGQFEESEEVDVVRRQFVLTKHKRKKYRCACNGCVETAPLPPRLIEGGRYSVDFAIEVAVSKYVDHAPLERQVRAMKREGLIVTSQTLWDQLEALARLLGSTHEALHQYVLSQCLVGADETNWRLMDGEGSKRWTVWTLCGADAVYYHLAGSHGQEEAAVLLKGYAGVVMVDGASVYRAVQRKQGGFAVVNCWSHVRRKFVAAEKFFPRECGEVLDLIGQLYGVEREAPPGPEGDAQRMKLRQEMSKPITDKILAWALEARKRALPQSALGQAIEYMLKLWPGLTAFLNDGRIPLDNNATERAERGIVCGRKNHYGSRSKRGTEVAALFYSLVESCRLSEKDPRAYLRAAADAALAGQPILLPHEFTQS
jgi:transposase